MKRDPLAFLSDVIEAGQAILQAVDGIIIGEALTQLSQRDQALFGEIEPAPQIISFRNKLTHEYITINNQLVWGVIKNNLPVLVDQCRQLLARLDRELP